ncbi:helix-turn-helix transcriptional regulator [Nocardia yamanashiensis]|uniref:helix-turn-helix transcriptional regulator n=1 Tax=Nocardia yamanashiensis TaxID=209247 RepID=UPI001F2112B3|nr:helix-turn-helix transcriptional regulator [Nocardia yamanashiensis]
MDVANGNAAGSRTRSAGKARREELSAFLKSRRARITPQDVGLPVGSRRRTPGLRREEVAQLAGVGVTWYTWLEQGRDINASIQVLDAISRTLCLDGVEKAHLYRLADVPTVPTPQHEDPISEEIQVILDHLNPLPAALLSARYDVLAHNSAYEALCPAFTRGDRNVLRKVFLSPECCNPYPSTGPEHQARMVAYLRAAYVRHLQDPAWTTFVDDLCAQSTLFATMWARNDVALPIGRSRTIRNLAIGDLEMIMTSMSLPSIAGAWVQIWQPVDAAGWTCLHGLLAMTPEEREIPWREHLERDHGYVAG